MDKVGRGAQGEEAAMLEILYSYPAKRRPWPPLSRTRISPPSPLGGLRLPNLNMPRSILRKTYNPYATSYLS